MLQTSCFTVHKSYKSTGLVTGPDLTRAQICLNKIWQNNLTFGEMHLPASSGLHHRAGRYHRIWFWQMGIIWEICHDSPWQAKSEYIFIPTKQVAKHEAFPFTILMLLLNKTHVQQIFLSEGNIIHLLAECKHIILGTCTLLNFFHFTSDKILYFIFYRTLYLFDSFSSFFAYSR